MLSLTPDAPALSADVALGLLHDSTRREVLRELIAAGNDAVSVDELAAETGSDRATTKVSLYHIHLPKLADAGVIDWDRDSGTVQYQPSEPLENILHNLSRQFDEPEPTVTR